MALDQIDIDKYEFEDPEQKRLKSTEMSFFDHIDVLRWHLIRSVAVVAVIMVFAFSAKDFVFTEIIYGPKNPNFVTYRFMCQLAARTGVSDFCITPPKFTTIATNLGEQFFTHLQISFILGFIAAFPYIFWEFWRFISPALKNSERRSASRIIAICSFLFFLGVSFGYFIIAPFAISFLAGYAIPDTVTMPTLASYIDYMVMFTLPIGLVFELPILIYFLSKVGLVTADMLRSFRRHSVVAILIVAGIITPGPDVVSQMLVGIPLYILFEISILVSARVGKNKG